MESVAVSVVDCLGRYACFFFFLRGSIATIHSFGGFGTVDSFVGLSVFIKSNLLLMFCVC